MKYHILFTTGVPALLVLAGCTSDPYAGPVPDGSPVEMPEEQEFAVKDLWVIQFEDGNLKAV